MIVAAQEYAECPNFGHPGGINGEQQPMTSVSSFAVRLKSLRMRKGESLQQVADAVGASKAHIWELERGGSKRPSIELVVKLAEHFGVTVASLIGENPDLPGEDEELVVMYRDMQSLSKDDRDTISMLIKGMRERRKQKEREDDDQD